MTSENHEFTQVASGSETTELNDSAIEPKLIISDNDRPRRHFDDQIKPQSSASCA